MPSGNTYSDTTTKGNLIGIIVSFVVAVVCLIIAILFVALPLVTIKIGNVKRNAYLTKESAVVNMSSSLAKSAVAFGVLTLIAAIFLVIFYIVYLAMTCAYNSGRKKADAGRERIYDEANEKRVSESERSERHNEVYLRTTPSHAEEMNDTLDSYHTKEDKRRSAERGIGVTIFVLWVALLVFSILALVLYGAFFGSSVNSKGYGGDNGLLNYMLGLSGAKTSRSLQGGYFIMIIVVVIAIVMVILTACCPCTQGIYVCGRDGPVVDDKVFKATEESANTRTTGREEYYSPPQSVQKPRYDDSPTKKPTYNYDIPPNNNIQVNTNHNNGYPDAAYGVPLALPGPQLPPGATPEDIQRSYQALGLPDPNYKGKSVS